MVNPRISIIVATFNADATLNIALDSVQHQSFQDWECIIVDGVSSDNTIEIIHSYVELDDRFRYVSEPDKGIYDAFNKGWKLAKGEWIYYLGADDQLLYDGLDNLLNESQNEIDVIYGNVVYKRKDKLLYRKSNKNITSIKRGMFCCHQALIMKKQVIEGLGGFNINYRISADYDLVLRAYLKGGCFKYSDVNVAIFNSEGISSNFNVEGYIIRKNNFSVNCVDNLMILLKVTILKALRNFKYYLLNCCN